MCLLNAVCSPIFLKAQVISFPYTPSSEDDERSGSYLEFLPDSALKGRLVGSIVDNVFVGTLRLGVDPQKVELLPDMPQPPFVIRGIGSGNDTLLVKSYDELKDTLIGGHPFPYLFFENLRAKEKIEWVTINELKNKYFPALSGPIMYTVNKYIITDDYDLYKFDKDFIYRIECFSSHEIPGFQSLPQFTIFRIFTKTRHNWDWMWQKYEVEE